MVSKASEDLPEPETPVMTTSLSRGITTSMFLRLCSRAPRTIMESRGMPAPLELAGSAAHVTLSEAKGLAGDQWGMPPGEILRSLRSLRMTGGLVVLAGAAH